MERMQVSRKAASATFATMAGPSAPVTASSIATNSYRAGGGASFPGTGADAIIYRGTEPTRDVLMRLPAEGRPRRGPTTRQLALHADARHDRPL